MAPVRRTVIDTSARSVANTGWWTDDAIHPHRLEAQRPAQERGQRGVPRPCRDGVLAGVPSGEVQDQALQALLDRVHVLGAEVMSEPAGETSSERSERRESGSKVSDGVERSCHTCEDFSDGHGYEYDEADECHHKNPPMTYLRNFPFEHGCKFWSPKWYLTKGGQEFIDEEVKKCRMGDQ